MNRRFLFFRSASLALVVTVATGYFSVRISQFLAPSPAVQPTGTSTKGVSPEALGLRDDGLPYAFHGPTGEPASITCRHARQVVQQARNLLAAPAQSVDPTSFAEALTDWLDPNGMWAIAPDAPMAAALQKQAPALLRELESTSNANDCVVAAQLGAQLQQWVVGLRPIMLQAHAAAQAGSIDEAIALAQKPLVEENSPPPLARELAAELGHRLGVIHRSLQASLDSVIQTAMDRALPTAPLPWADVLLAAALRSYLPQIDPHGGWAPFEEETSLYEADLEASPPPRLWRRMTLTAVGIRIDETMHPSLASGDVLLGIEDLFTAGLSVEQSEQLSLWNHHEETSTFPTRNALVFTAAARTVQWIELSYSKEEPDTHLTTHLPPTLSRIAFGDGDVVVIPIDDVPDNLGSELALTLAQARDPHSPKGVILDLRGNGGGSTDGANRALGLFLPGVPLFPLRRRDGSVEVERAPVPPASDRWAGPVACLIDGDTASAAEMIAGALASYRRGPTLGSRTYGKGCAQEYLDDQAECGVLRLTTLVYALPDGSPVQRVGIAPTFPLFSNRPGERESSLNHTLAPWRGPDVRDVAFVKNVPWPGHGGRVGPCDDEAVCKALRTLGSPKAAVARGTLRTRMQPLLRGRKRKRLHEVRATLMAIETNIRATREFCFGFSVEIFGPIPTIRAFFHDGNNLKLASI